MLPGGSITRRGGDSSAIRTSVGRGDDGVPFDVELLSQELPVLPLGVGRVEGGADPLTDRQGDFKGP